MLIVEWFSVNWQSISEGHSSDVFLSAFEFGFICALLCQSPVFLTVLRVISFEPKSKVNQFWLTRLIRTSMIVAIGISYYRF